MKSTLKKLLALVLCLTLIAVPVGTVYAEADDEPVVTTGEESAEGEEPAEDPLNELADDLSFIQSLVETSTLPQVVIDILVMAIGAYRDYSSETLVNEDGEPMTDEEAAMFMITELVTMVITVVELLIQVVNMVSEMAAEAETSEEAVA